MLQFTLARDALLVGYGAARACDVSPLEALPRPRAGVRPSLFFAPTRDAAGLLSRKTFTHLLLVRKTQVDGLSRALVLPFPTNEWVPDSHLETLLAIDHPLGVANCVALESQLHPEADISSTRFLFEHPELKHPVAVRIEGFVFENTLREQFVLEHVPAEFACYVVHCHQPEIATSQQGQTTYAHLQMGALISYRHGHFFAVKLEQMSAPVQPAFATCVQLQAGHCAVRDLAYRLSALLNTIKQLGSGASAAVRAQVLCSWQKLQSEPIATGTSQGIIVWPVDTQIPFELQTGWRTSLEAAAQRWSSSFVTARAAILASDAAWLVKMRDRRKVDLPDAITSLYQRSLLTLKQMQDPTGGIIAAPEFQFEFTACGGYGYCWGRDAGFISLAMDTAGLYDESALFYRYMAKCQAENGSFLHRHDMNGHLGPSWGLLQPDETGSVLFGLWQHVKISGRKETAEQLRGMVERGAQWLASYRFGETEWLGEGFDLWEEREGVHLYSVAAAIAGLRAAADLADALQWSSPVSTWRARADVLSKLLEGHLLTEQNPVEIAFARTLFLKNTAHCPGLAEHTPSSVSSAGLLEPKRWSSDFVVDVSLLGVVEPFEAVSEKFAERTLPTLCKAIREKLWRSGAGGIGRYEGDHYRNGQPWILTTLWLALAAQRCADKQLAVECLAWVLAHVPEEGQLPEQVNPVTGEPAWVMPLTWSHAMFVLACVQVPKDVWVSAVQNLNSFKSKLKQNL